MSPPPAPGWYPDPHDPAFLRFFDGTSWTTGRARAFPDEIARATGAETADGPATDEPAAATDPAGSDPDDAPADDDTTPDVGPTVHPTPDSAPTDHPTPDSAPTDQPTPGDSAPTNDTTPDVGPTDDTTPDHRTPDGAAPGDTGVAGGAVDPGSESSGPAARGASGDRGEALAGTLHLSRLSPSIPAAPPPAATEPLTTPGPDLDPGASATEHAAPVPGPDGRATTTTGDPVIPEPPRLDGQPESSGPPAATITAPGAGGWASPPPPPPPPIAGAPPTEPFTPRRVIHLPNATIHTTTSRPPGRRRLLVGGGLVATALVVAGALLVLPDDAPDLEWQGQDIQQPGETLEAAEAIVESLVDERHGVLHDDGRCYFGVPAGQSDQVDEHLRCGPVLFVDGDPGEPYLSFPLTASDAGTGVRLTVGEQPVEPDPAAVGADVELVRHDGKRPPSGAGGLEPPDPPPAADDLVDAVELGTASLGTPPEGAAIGSLNASYELTGLATVDRFGTGDDARRAPEGHQLIAFELAQGPGETPLATGTPALSVQVDGGSPRDITELVGSGDTIVVAAPEDAESVDLVVTDAEVEQRLSLLDGTPAPGNLRVLTRANRSQQIGAVHQVTATGTDSAGSVPVSGTINVESVHLDWFLREDPTKRAANGDAALLVVTLSYNWVEITPPDAGLAEQAFTLAMPDGNTLPAFNLAADPANSIIVAFEVPADFTTGTLNIGGVVTQPGGVTIDFGASVYPTAVSIPAG